LSNLNELFGQGSVLNNCTFNINFNVPTMSQSSCDYNPPRKYRKILPIVTPLIVHRTKRLYYC
jgi:hypothetical protein